MREELCVDVSERMLVHYARRTDLLEPLVHELELLPRELGASAEVLDALRLTAHRGHFHLFHGVVGKAHVCPGLPHQSSNALVGPEHGGRYSHGQVQSRCRRRGKVRLCRALLVVGHRPGQASPTQPSSWQGRPTRATRCPLGIRVGFELHSDLGDDTGVLRSGTRGGCASSASIGGDTVGASLTNTYDDVPQVTARLAGTIPGKRGMGTHHHCY